MKLRNYVQRLLWDCGMQVGGDAPHDIRVCNEDFYARVPAGGSMTLGESYMEGRWETPCLDGSIYRLLSGRPDERARVDLLRG